LSTEQIAPAAGPIPPRSIEKCFIARKAIYRADLSVFAYELLFRNNELNEPAFANGDQATAQVVLNAFMEIGLDRVVGQSLAFVQVSRSFLLSDYCLLLPKERLILQLSEDTIPDAPMLDAISRLRKEGYLFGLDTAQYAEWLRPLLALVDIAKLDLQVVGREAMDSHVELLRQFGIKLLAKGVESHEDYERCKKSGFDFYEGPFISKPQLLIGDKMPANRMAALRLLAKLQDPNLTTEQLEQTVSQDVTLSYKLLRYVNSAMHSLPNEVSSIRHAIVLVGTRRISNWAGLILYGQMNDKPSELMITATVRARMCQQLAQVTGQGNSEQFFTVGLFSVLDALLDRSMSNALDSLPLAAELKAALVDHQGAMGSALLCVMAYEVGDWERAECAGIPADAIYEAYVSALEWTRRTMKELGIEPDLRPQESIRRRSEAKLSLQKFADAQEQQIKQAEEEARKKVTRDLLARFDIEFQKLTLELDERKQSAVAAAEKAAQVRFEQTLNEAETARSLLKAEFEGAAEKWKSERQQLLLDQETAHHAVQVKSHELAELTDQISGLTREKALLEEQLQTVKSEMQRLQADFATERREAVAEAEAAAEIRLEKVRAQTLEPAPIAPARATVPPDAIHAEIARVAASIQDLAEKIESPATDLAAQIRFNRERSELEAYVRGLRFNPNKDDAAQ
jgi:EAL and modified HD-GYP domain-containing signal transduction protein